MDSHEVPLAGVEQLQDLAPVRFGFLRTRQLRHGGGVRAQDFAHGHARNPQRPRDLALRHSRLSSSRIVVRWAWLNMRCLLREKFFVNAPELFFNPVDLLPCGFALLVIQFHGRRPCQLPMGAVHHRRYHLQIADQFGGWPRRNLRLPLGFEKQPRIIQNAFPDRGRSPPPGGIQLAGFACVAVMLGEEGRHPLAILQALPRRRHQKLHRHLRRELAFAYLLLDDLRQKLHQRQPPRYPARAAIEPPCQLIQAVAETPLQLLKQPTTSNAVSCSDKRSERSSSTAAASLIGHTTASTVSRPSCSSAAIRL